MRDVAPTASGPYVAVAGDPTDIGGAPIDVLVVVVEGIAEGRGGVEQVAGSGVENALRLPGRPGRVEDEERILGIHPLDVAVPSDVRSTNLLVVPEVSSGLHVDARTRPGDDDDRLDGRALVKGVVSLGFEGHDATAADSFVGRDEKLGTAILDPVAERRGGEATEDDRVDRADARAGEHGDDELGDHRHIDRDAIALADPVLPEDVRELAHLVVERLVRVHLRPTLVGLPDERGLVAAPSLKMPIDAVVGDVELPALEPFDSRGIELVVQYRVPLLVPVEHLLGHVSPEALGILDGPRVERFVLFHGLDVCALGDPCGRVYDAEFLRQRLDMLLVGHATPPSIRCDTAPKPDTQGAYWYARFSQGGTASHNGSGPTRGNRLPFGYAAANPRSAAARVRVCRNPAPDGESPCNNCCNVLLRGVDSG
jgi:hypothetical protein